MGRQTTNIDIDIGIDLDVDAYINMDIDITTKISMDMDIGIDQQVRYRLREPALQFVVSGPGDHRFSFLLCSRTVCVGMYGM